MIPIYFRKAFIILLHFAVFFILSNQFFAQVEGCTDPLSQNFNPLAEVNDGSCTYTTASISITNSTALSDSLAETSGLIQWNGQIWSHNDNDDNHLYAINPVDGTIDSMLEIPTVNNNDWEDVSQDESYIYLGDFGNNSQGNRTDLHILRILKSSFPTNLQVDTINFSYSNQVDFNSQASNTTNFDCEAFIVATDSIFLFTKRWGDKRTMVYGFPKVPGNYIAAIKDSFNIQGLITGATFLENENLISICGYSTILQPFVWLLYDFEGTNFLKGNKRKLTLPLPITQVEGITTVDGLNYFVSNELFVNGPIVSPQKLHSFNLSSFLDGYLTGNFAAINQIKNLAFSIFPNPTEGHFSIQCNFDATGKEFSIYNTSGNQINTGKISKFNDTFQILEKGIYFIEISGLVHKIVVQ